MISNVIAINSNLLSTFSLFNVSSNTFLCNYLPIGIFIIISFILVVGILSASYIIVPQKPYANKNDVYECGFDSMFSARNLFNIKFFLVAILFLIFDLEVLFLYPFAIVIKDISTFGFISMLIFLFIVTVGFVYELKKGILEWD